MKKMPKIALSLGLCAAVLCFNASSLRAQDKPAAAKEGAAEPKGTVLPDGYTLLPSGLEYKVIKHGTGKKHPKITDHIEMNISFSISDSLVYESRKMNSDKPVPLQVAEPKMKGDPLEAFPRLVVGDSAVIRYPVDSMKKAGMNLPPFAKPGTNIVYTLSLVSLKTDEEDKKESAENAAKQKVIDEKILADYFKKNNIKPLKTADGLYYTIEKEGHGPNIKAGESVNVNYTGMFLDGKKFDSNVDTSFKHMTPFTVDVAKGKVIKGWDEGLQLLKLGAKAKFYIPSGLAYGPQERSPIPANSILMFELETSAVPDPLGEYFETNHIKATKTASGLYYKITKEGTGDLMKPGEKVKMAYKGTLLNGKVFDKNVDDNFVCANPFSFVLGKGQVIAGWDEGVQLLKVGSKATLYLPANLAYGEHGTGGIPPSSPLIFDVEVIGVEK